MGSHLVSSNAEAAIWARLMQAQKHELPSEAAEFLLSIDFADADRQRMLQLAERSEAGALTAEEQAEFDGYLRVGNLLAVMQSKARLTGSPSLVNRDVARKVRQRALARQHGGQTSLSALQSAQRSESRWNRS
jgi:hypothetical protein